MRLCTILCVYANTLNVKLSNSQLIKLKSGIKNRFEVTLKLSSKLVGNSNDETIFPYKLMLTDAHISKIEKAFANASTVNINFSKIQLSKMQAGGFIYPEWYNKISPFRTTNLVANSIKKELKNKGSKELKEEIMK